MMFDPSDACYVIHLPNAERRTHVEAELKRVGLLGAAQFVHAERPPSGFKVSNMRRNPPAEFGCALSHVKAWVQALASGAQTALFFEDDIRFTENAGEVLRSAAADMPADWAMCFLGGHPRSKVERVGANVVRVGTWSCAEAYAVQRAHLLPLINYWFDRAAKPDAMVDFIAGEYASRTKSYALYPPVTEQALMKSHISGGVDDKRALIARGWANNLA